MNRSNNAVDLEPTLLAQGTPPAALPMQTIDSTPAKPKHGPMALVQGSGPHFTDEVHDLLRRRLRLACAIVARSNLLARSRGFTVAC